MRPEKSHTSCTFRGRSSSKRPSHLRRWWSYCQAWVSGSTAMFFPKILVHPGPLQSLIQCRGPRSPSGDSHLSSISKASALLVGSHHSREDGTHIANTCPAQETSPHLFLLQCHLRNCLPPPGTVALSTGHSRKQPCSYPTLFSSHYLLVQGQAPEPVCPLSGIFGIGNQGSNLVLWQNL